MDDNLRSVLTDLAEGRISVPEAELRLKTAPYRNLGYARIDFHRRLRQGTGEVIYGAGKTAEQISGIIGGMLSGGQTRILVTRLSAEKYARLEIPGDCPFEYSEEAQLLTIGTRKVPDGLGRIIVATGGTSDIPVAEEAALTAEFLGNEVSRLYDVGVAGLHRLLPHIEEFMTANAIIAVAGMEGALASVIGGLADCPVIAVPTSVGYGASFGGVSALLYMLNSCASGVSVVNIDNGFGAAFIASRVNHPKTDQPFGN